MVTHKTGHRLVEIAFKGKVYQLETYPVSPGRITIMKSVAETCDKVLGKYKAGDAISQKDFGDTEKARLHSMAQTLPNCEPLPDEYFYSDEINSLVTPDLYAFFLSNAVMPRIKQP